MCWLLFAVVLIIFCSFDEAIHAAGQGANLVVAWRG